MKAFLAVCADDAGRVEQLASRAGAAAARSLPFRTGLLSTSWMSADGRCFLHAWSNERSEPTPNVMSGAAGSGAVLVSGHLEGTLPGPDLPDEALAAAGGVWSVGTVEDTGAGSRVRAATCASGAEQLFLARFDGGWALGNRALLLHLFCEPAGPRPDLVGLAGVALTGYCTTDRTAFAGVEAVPVGTTVTLTPGRPPVTRTWTDGRFHATATADLVQALLDSVGSLRATSTPVRLGLTGGRDSRLVAAVLVRAGVPVDCHTAGFDDDPDVVVARQVAALVGVDHRVTAPYGATIAGDAVDVDVDARLREAVVLADGMLGAYDRVGRIDDRFQRGLTPFSGAGGEILRGYYAGALAETTDDAVVRHLRFRLLTGADRLAPEVRTAYRADVEPWFAAARSQGPVALERFYVEQRTRRWTGAARGSASIGSLARRPFLDNRVVALVRSLPLAARTSEEVVARAMDGLVPGLSGLRFAGHRWRFDVEPAPDGPEHDAWRQRAPLSGRHGDQTTFSWRTDLPGVREHLRQRVLDAGGATWDLLDRRQVERFLAQEPAGRADTIRRWHLATVATALEGAFLARPDDRFDRIERAVTYARVLAEDRPSRRRRWAPRWRT